MGHRSSKFKFDLMGNSLSHLHALGKFPEINRKKCQQLFSHFQGFPLIISI